MRSKCRYFGLATLAFAIVLIAFSFTVQPASATAVTVVNVHSNNSLGWAFQQDDCGYGHATTGTYAFVQGPPTPPMGIGSFQFSVGSFGGSSLKMRLSGLDGTKVSDLTTLTYWTYAQSGGSGNEQDPYIRLYVYNPGDASNDTLFFEPYYQTHAHGNASLPDQGALVYGTWQMWNALEGGWWSNSGDGGLNPGANVKPLSDYLAVHPNSAITDASGGGGLAVAAGCGAASWPDFIGNFDALTVGVSGSPATTYNFDFSTVAVPTVSLAGLLLLGLLLAAGALAVIRR